jgi:hemolysin activation/secretion protein
MAGFDKRAGDFNSLESSLAFYHTFRFPARIVFAARVGAGINSGDYEFYQTQILDGRTELRGYRKTRFYGDSKFYTNLEARIKLLSMRSYLFPATLGLVAFHDLGRVWYTGENSNTWHKGWGGGIWFTPFNLTVISFEAAHSKEGTLGYVRLGFLF